jgi:hypothetical protein
VAVTKRIRQDLRIARTVEEFMPDILDDWRLAQEMVPQICEEEHCPYVVGYVKHTWRELWRMPPPVNEAALVPGTEGDDAAIDAQGAQKGAVVAEFSPRDLMFLKGRSAREAPALSVGLAVIVALQFLLSLVVGYSFLLQSGEKRAAAPEVPDAAVNSTASGADVALLAVEQELTRMCNAMVCIGCVLLLQTIKFYYK